MKLPNISLTGALRSGKDVVAAYLTQKYGYIRFAFGDELKRHADEIFGVKLGEYVGKPRELYQWFGHTMRQRDPDVWVHKCFDKIIRAGVDCANDNGNYPYPFRAAITDLRQPNEYVRCRAKGYVFVRVKARKYTRSIHRFHCARTTRSAYGSRTGTRRRGNRYFARGFTRK